MFLVDADEPGVWVTGRSIGIDLLRFDGAMMSLEVEDLVSDAEIVAAPLPAFRSWKMTVTP